MANVERLKRQILRDLVQENVELKQGRLPRRLRRRNSFRISARFLTLLLLPIGLLGSSRLISFDPQPAPAPAAAAAVQAAKVEAGARERQVRLAPLAPIDAAVFPLAVRKVAIDPGHGGRSTGTRTPSGLVEKELTLDVAERLRKLLLADGFEVLMTRRSDSEVSLEQRGVMANEGEADIFVSIHVNWIENREARGVETYYLGATEDPFLTRLAASENRDSGYSLADMRSLLDRIYADVRQDKSRKLAEVVQASLFSSLRKVNPKLEDRGVKAAPFIVLLSTEMPAILAEVSCLSNEGEAELLSKPLYRQYIAEALAKGVRSYAGAVEEKPQPAQISKKGT